MRILNTVSIDLYETWNRKALFTGDHGCYPRYEHDKISISGLQQRVWCFKKAAYQVIALPFSTLMRTAWAIDRVAETAYTVYKKHVVKDPSYAPISLREKAVHIVDDSLAAMIRPFSKLIIAIRYLAGALIHPSFALYDGELPQNRMRLAKQLLMNNMYELRDHDITQWHNNHEFYVASPVQPYDSLHNELLSQFERSSDVEEQLAYQKQLAYTLNESRLRARTTILLRKALTNFDTSILFELDRLCSPSDPLLANVDNFARKFASDLGPLLKGFEPEGLHAEITSANFSTHLAAALKEPTQTALAGCIQYLNSLSTGIQLKYENTCIELKTTATRLSLAQTTLLACLAQAFVIKDKPATKPLITSYDLRESDPEFFSSTFGKNPILASTIQDLQVRASSSGCHTLVDLIHAIAPISKNLSTIQFEQRSTFALSTNLISAVTSLQLHIKKLSVRSTGIEETYQFRLIDELVKRCPKLETVELPVDPRVIELYQKHYPKIQWKSTLVSESIATLTLK